MIIRNPELLRNIWLEMTPHRLMSMPLLLGAYFFLLFVMGDYQFNHADAMQALSISALLTLVWGAHMTAESVLSEVRDNTWDAQRMSAMPAWRLVWGKLLGSSLFSWYGASICFLLFIAVNDFDAMHAVKIIFLYLMAGLLAQATSMLLALLYIRKKISLQRSHTLFFTLISAFTAWQFIAVAGKGAGTLNWFGLTFFTLEFTLMSLMAWLIWTWVGCHQLMRSELQTPNKIWMWFGFVLWSIVYLTGFVPLSEVVAVLPYIALSVSMLMTYSMLFSESKDPVAMGNLLRILMKKDWSQLQLVMPCWLMSMLLMVLAGLLLVLLGKPSAYVSIAPLGQALDYVSPMLVWTAILFVFRDICFVLWLNFSSQLKRPDLAAMLYLTISYTLLPLILSALNMDVVRMVLLPGKDAGAVGLVIAAAEVLLFFWLMRSRWQKHYARNGAEYGE
ncbi:MAG: hypothetical protein Q9M17_10670 [Mariprofundus sp.]|nr:hypothetical protein [Mariprofundus sp.]